MFLYPYKIFTISKDKRILKRNEKKQFAIPVGIYEAEKLNYYDACCELDKDYIDKYRGNSTYAISVLLGELVGGIKLICLDLDDCFTEEGEIEPETREFLKEFKLEEYEVSSSGTGIHIYILTRLDLETFIVKDLEGCKSFECYTNKRHIVTTSFDFECTDLKVGVHDKFILELYKRMEEKRGSTLKRDVEIIFEGQVVPDTEQEMNSHLFKRTPVTDMYTLRKCGYKDGGLIEAIDAVPDHVDQSAHDAKLIRKLMYYTLSFDSAWEMAMKTNYYKAKDDAHKKKFNSDRYKERTRRFIERGY